MSRLFENRFYNTVFMLITVGASLIYIWFGVKLTAPKTHLPKSIASLRLAEKNQELSLQDAMVEHAYMLSGVLKSLKSFDSSIALVGGLRKRVAVVISLEDPKRYLVTDSRVEIGSRLFEQTGQLEKALVKAWVFQMARPDISGSLLRTEVASDLLWAMLNGDLNIEKLEFPEVTSWLSFATSFANHCASPWISLELGGLCSSRDVSSSDAIQSIGFRPLLDAMAWSVFRDLSLSQRIEFIRAWTLWVTKEPPQPEQDRPNSIDDWRAWLRTEFASLIPKKIQGSDLGSAVNKALFTAGLQGPQSFEVGYLFRADQAKLEDTAGLAATITHGNRHFWKSPVTAVVQTSEGFYTLPGRARLPDDGTQFLKYKETIWEACKAPDLHDMMTDQVHSDRILLVQSCGAPWQALYSPLISLGVEGFAADNPTVPFALVKRLSMQLAEREGMTPKESLLRDLLAKSDELAKVSPNIGLKEAKWHAEIKAYQVLGAVEAVEWYRSTKDL